MKSLALCHIEDLDRKIAELPAIKKVLQHIAEKCRDDDRPDCPILDDLGSGTSNLARRLFVDSPVIRGKESIASSETMTTFCS